MLQQKRLGKVKIVQLLDVLKHSSEGTATGGD